MSRIPDNIIKQAKDTDIIRFLESYGYSFKCKGQEYICNEHDSLMFGIADNGVQAYTWHSKADKGDSIKFVITYITNGDFRKAIFLLTGWNDRNNYKEKKLIQAPTHVQVSLNISYSKNMQRAFAYLIKNRLIDPIIIKELVKSKYIAQDIRNNVIFNWIFNGDLKGADLIGTLSEKRFKGTVTASNENFGFAVPLNTNINKIDTLVVFESNIDLLSFYTLNKDNKKLNSMLLLSLSGVSKTKKIRTYLNYYTNIKTIISAVDNDSSGNHCTDNIKNSYTNYKILDGRRKLLENNVKDWNELLKKEKV